MEDKMYLIAYESYIGGRIITEIYTAFNMQGAIDKFRATDKASPIIAVSDITGCNYKDFE